MSPDKLVNEFHTMCSAIDPDSGCVEFMKHESHSGSYSEYARISSCMTMSKKMSRTYHERVTCSKHSDVAMSRYGAPTGGS